ncbi:MAG: Esterase PHB depolymerase [Syntrophorhabdus sp. PtaU1.Bin153]|nr:MAG: Esterase PHB depolymerase [Syntrophorhabdus sp. PtaU1.Bin153]
MVIACILFVWSPVFAQTNKAEVYQGSVNVGGLERTYVVHVPAGHGLSKEKALPLVLVLHGGGGNASSAARISGFNAKSNQEGFIVVYPNGTGRFRKDVVLNWNAGNCCGYAMDNNIDDVAFIKAVIDKVQRDHNVDRKRVFAAGLANGGMMAYRAACELSDMIAAIAPVSGALNVRECKPRFPVSVVIFHGTADGHVLYQGGEPKKLFERLRKRVDKPVSYAVSLWVRSNGCSPVPLKEQRGSVVRETYTGGKDGTEVSVYTIKGEGHTWPGGKKGRYPGADEPTQEISATDVMWEFFKNHPKP